MGGKISSNFRGAAKKGNIKKLAVLLEKYPELLESKSKDYENTALMGALRFRRDEAVMWLLEHGANPNLTNKFDATCLEIAVIDKNSIRVIDMLVEKGADPLRIGSSGVSLLMYACEFGDIEMVKKIMTYDDDLERRTPLGCTLLHFAAENKNRNNSYDITQFLLNKGVDRTIGTHKFDMKPSDFASHKKVKQLLLSGANSNEDSANANKENPGNKK